MAGTSASATSDRSHALRLLLDDPAGDDLLSALIDTLTTRDACTLAAVSWRWARAAEDGLQAACGRLRWRPPRRARLQGAAALAALPWRTLFVSRACRACLNAAGDYAVRGHPSSAPSAFLCARCAKAAHVVAKLQRDRSSLDVTGLSGKPLYTGKQDKFCADQSKLSKESFDHASGSRVEARGAGRARR